VNESRKEFKKEKCNIKKCEWYDIKVECCHEFVECYIKWLEKKLSTTIPKSEAIEKSVVRECIPDECFKCALPNCGECRLQEEVKLKSLINIVNKDLMDKVGE
jgi:hypothetical protein